MLPYIMTLLAVAGIAAGQILFKMTAMRLEGRALVDLRNDLSFMTPMAVALFIYGIATVLWTLALRELELSQAYMFMSLAFVIVPVLSWLLFEEKLTAGFLIGMTLIVLGLVVTQISA